MKKLLDKLFHRDGVNLTLSEESVKMKEGTLASPYVALIAQSGVYSVGKLLPRDTLTRSMPKWKDMDDAIIDYIDVIDGTGYVSSKGKVIATVKNIIKSSRNVGGRA